MKRLFWIVMGKIARITASLSGHDLVTQNKLRSHDRALRTLMEKEKINIVFDIGANEGQFYKYLRDKIHYRGLICCVEPTNQPFSVLEAEIKKDKLALAIKGAIGDSNTDLVINTFQDSAINSALEPSETGLNRYGETIGKETVRCQTFDNLVNHLISTNFLEHNFKAFVKIDTQGFDHAVLSGMKDYLERVQLLQIEASCIPIYTDMPTYLDTLELLNSLGFNPVSFYPVSRNSNFALVEFDLLSLRNKAS